MFADAAFFKPTGDGLLIVHRLPDTSEQVVPLVSAVLQRCIALVDDFPTLTADDLMVNFAVPQQLGIGVARGSATRLISDGIVLDYTGRCLNLAARLMDKARPSGVVFADGHATDLMDEEVTEYFMEDTVYIRGIAEEDPMPVMRTDAVRLSPRDREPITAVGKEWGAQTVMTVADVKKHSRFNFYLPRRPATFETVGVEVEIPDFADGKPTSYVTSLILTGEVDDNQNGSLVSVPFEALHEIIQDLPESIDGLLRPRATNITFIPFIDGHTD